MAEGAIVGTGVLVVDQVSGAGTISGGIGSHIQINAGTLGDVTSQGDVLLGYGLATLLTVHAGTGELHAGGPPGCLPRKVTTLAAHLGGPPPVAARSDDGVAAGECAVRGAGAP